MAWITQRKRRGLHEATLNATSYGSQTREEMHLCVYALN
jgi:hypothetical protein